MIANVTSWKVGHSKGYSEKMVKEQILQVHEHSRERLLENVKSDSNQKKLTFNHLISYYLVYQNVKNILQELHILLTSDKEHKKLFQDIPGVGFHDSESQKDHLFKKKSLNVEITGRSESCGKANCQVFEFICDTDTLSTKACGEAFKIKHSK